jgi:hypothetical protein
MYTDIIHLINMEFDNLLNIRARFPTCPDEAIGQNRFSTAPYYQYHLKFNVIFEFETPITNEMKDKINRIGRWANESYVIRLCALLESHGIMPQGEGNHINELLDGHEEMQILKDLRNVLAHTSGRYDPKKSSHRKLYERMVKEFSLKTESSTAASAFPVHINDFLEPLTDGCKRYVQAFARCVANR